MYSAWSSRFWTSRNGVKNGEARLTAKLQTRTQSTTPRRSLRTATRSRSRARARSARSLIRLLTPVRFNSSARFTTGTMYTDKLYTGQREMAGLGIYHYNARFYSPKLGAS